MTEHYDLIVLGGGSGGIATANRAARYGARCALIEKGPLGGTCVNVGCVPKKIFWNAAGIRHSLSMAAEYGFTKPAVKFDWQALKKARDAYIRKLNGRYASGLDDNNVRLLRGHGRFIGPHSLQVNGETYSADHIVVATGGRPIVPDIPGAALGITSDGFFALTEQPARVAVIGAGYIAVELAGVLNELGSDVSLLMRRAHFLDGFDAMLREGLMGAMIQAGVGMATHRNVTAIQKNHEGLEVLFRDHEPLSGLDCVIWAVGRTPSTTDLGLQDAGLKVSEDGFLKTDAFENTEVPGLYAVGDITGRAALTPVAIAAGRRLADRLFGGMSDRRLDYTLIPTVIFSHPPIGTIGLTEEAARERHGGEGIKVYQTQFSPMVQAFSADPIKTAMKLVTVGQEERIVGLHVLGESADEMLQGFAVALRMGATKRDFDDTLAIHPTSAEEFVTMR